MKTTSRRQLLKNLGGAAAGLGATRHVFGGTAPLRNRQEPKDCALALEDYEPKSMLHVTETKVERARYPVIDFHTHLSGVDRSSDEPKMKLNATRGQVIPAMDRRNVRIMVNLTGGYGAALDESVRYWQDPHPDRFVVFTEPWYARFLEPGYPKLQADEIERARRVGAKGLKLTKALGLYLREQITSGPLVPVDDRRFDPMWEAAGAQKMPVAIHTSDPEAFFLETNRYNERYEELSAHPNWSFNGRDFPSNRELHEARNRVVGRHPNTQFVLLHVGDSENLVWVSEWLDRYPNMSVEFGARIGELGRQPRASIKFFDKYQDRILFGTDAVPEGFETPQQVFGDDLYRIYYRFLETEDEYFDYAPAKVPPQGRWKIYGLGLSNQILRKVYSGNAARLLGLES